MGEDTLRKLAVLRARQARPTCDPADRINSYLKAIERGETEKYWYLRKQRRKYV